MKRTIQRRRYNARIFKRQVVVFVSCTVLLLGAVIYFAFSKTSIIVTPLPLEQTAKVRVVVGPIPQDATGNDTAMPDVPGVAFAEQATASVTVTPKTVAGTEQPAKATGTVTLRNKSGRSQTLVAGTRLLSDGGVLFRTTQRADLLPGTAQDITVQADKEGKDGEIAPSHFTIVALWPGLQPAIYGESSQTFTGGTTSIASVSQNDLNEAQKKAYAQLESSARTQAEAELAQDPLSAKYSIIALANAHVTEDRGATVGEQRAAFTYAASGTVVVVAVDTDAWREKLQAKILSQQGTGTQLDHAALTQAVATVHESDAVKKIATLDVRAPTTATVDLANKIFDKANLTNRSREDILAYFAQFQQIGSVEVHFSPFWVVRTPSLPDHVLIKLLKPSITNTNTSNANSTVHENANTGSNAATDVTPDSNAVNTPTRNEN